MKIIKMGYSRNPWRLINSEGNEVWFPAGYDHPLLGKTIISHPVAGQTKKECLANTLSLLERTLGYIKKLEKEK